MLPSSSILKRTAETVIIAAIGGVLFNLTGFPAGLVSGAVLAVGIAALAGRSVLVPMPFARVVFVLIGISLGGVVTPETLSGITHWPMSILLLVTSTIFMMTATISYLRFVHGWDLESAIFGASPGALAQSMALAAEYGADLRAIAIVQTMRVVMLTVGLPAMLGLFGLTGAPVIRGLSGNNVAMELAILILASTFTAVVMLKVRFPGGLLFGAMIGSAVLHGTGLVHTGLPSWVINGTIIVLGAICGARFSGTTPRMLLSYLAAALGSFAVATGVVTIFVFVLLHLLPLRISDVVIAFAPGAQDTMMVLALSLHLDPIYVGAHHLSRFIIVSLAVPVLARRAATNSARRQALAADQAGTAMND